MLSQYAGDVKSSSGNIEVDRRMEQRGRSLQAQLQFMERNGRALEELVAKMMKAREEQEAFLGTFAKSLEDIAAQEECAPLAQCLGSLGESGQKLASESHDVMLLRPETEILQVVTQIQDWAIVPMKVCWLDRRAGEQGLTCGPVCFAEAAGRPGKGYKDRGKVAEGV
jgi:hypothetical protein